MTMTFPATRPPDAALSVIVPPTRGRNLPACSRGRCGTATSLLNHLSTCLYDGTDAVLAACAAARPRLRVLRHRRRSGQSAALRSGVKAARAEWIATLDGDGQNDPADLPRLLQACADAAADVRLFAGWRVKREDSASKRWASRFANVLRARLLHDATPDTGCGIKLFARDAFLELPAFDHMHRYLPALMQRAGWRTLSVPVNHRPRLHGRSKYDNLGRALAGISDLRGVLWLLRRGACVAADERVARDLETVP